MINYGYSLSISESDELKKFKESAAYGVYLKTISTSPSFQLIMKEHIKNIDVTEDINILKTQGKLHESVNAKAISDIFRQSLSKMAICLVADTILLKELEDVKMQDISSDLNKEGEITYLLGKAEKKYYEQAAKLAAENKLSETSVGYRGLITYLKQNNKTLNDLSGSIASAKKATSKKVAEAAMIMEPKTKKSASFDEDITL